MAAEEHEAKKHRGKLWAENTYQFLSLLMLPALS